MDFVTSMASTFYEKVDCRMVQLEVEYHRATLPQAKELGMYFAEWMRELLSPNCISKFLFNSRRCNLESILKNISDCRKSFSFIFDADVISPVVYNAKTLNAYEKKLCDARMRERWLDFDVSSDYPEYWRSCFENCQTPEQCKQAVLKIMNAPGKKMYALWRQHDIIGSFDCCAYLQNESRFRGSFRLRVALNCLDGGAADFSETLVAIARGAASLFTDLSARIALSPVGRPEPYVSPHMRYFGNFLPEEDPHNVELSYSRKEWYPYAYFCGAEWFNLLSPLQASLLPDLETESAAYDSIVAERHPNGAIIVRLRNPIDQTDVTNLADVRKVLYRVLYPGSIRLMLVHVRNPEQWSYLAKPRNQWDCLPILPEEIIVNETSILFRHSEWDSEQNPE